MALAWRSSVFVQFALVVLVSVVSTQAVSAAGLTASWTDNSGGRAAFELERRTMDNPGFATVAAVPAGFTSYVDSEIIEGVTYCYRVRAFDEFGESPYSGEACGAATVSTFSVTVRKTGTGKGIVAASGYAIWCGGSCAATYSAGTPVTLVAAPDDDSRFVGWRGGGCAGTARCIVTGNTALTVTAVFGRRNAAAPGPRQ